MTSLARDHFAAAHLAVAECADHTRVGEVRPAPCVAPVRYVSTAVVRTHCGDTPTPTRRRSSQWPGRVRPTTASRRCRNSTVPRGAAAGPESLLIHPMTPTTPARSRRCASSPLQGPLSLARNAAATAVPAGGFSTVHRGDARRAASSSPAHPHFVWTTPDPYENPSAAREVVSQFIR